MIGYVMVGTNNLDQSIKFYDELLEVFRDLEGMKLEGFEFFCETRSLPKSKAKSKSWDEV